MKNVIRIGLLVLALGVVLPAASHAIIIICSDYCTCFTSCGIFCYEYDGGPRTTCGEAGYDCVGSPSCQGGGLAASTPASLPAFLASLGSPRRAAMSPPPETPRGVPRGRLYIGWSR
jgi:hypothetical protein